MVKGNPRLERFPTYSCEKCKKVFIAKIKVNPKKNETEALKIPQEMNITDGRIPKEYGNAIKLFENFNMKPPDKIITANISLPDNNKNPLVWLGKISAITYISDKEGIRGQEYIHTTDGPVRPDFFCTADGKTFLIAGGKMKIQDGWLYY